MKTFNEYFKPSVSDIINENNINNLDKIKSSIISDFIKGNLKDIKVTYNLLDWKDKSVVKSDIKDSFNIFELNPFGSTKMLSWEELYGIITKDTKMLSSLKTYMDKDVLRFSFDKKSHSSIIYKIKSKILENNYRNDVEIVSIDY